MLLAIHFFSLSVALKLIVRSCKEYWMLKAINPGGGNAFEFEFEIELDFELNFELKIELNI